MSAMKKTDLTPASLAVDALPIANPDRRTFLRNASTVISAGVVIGTVGVPVAWGRNFASSIEDYKLPALPYAYDALEPIIDKETMTIHHTKHHQTYVTKLNEAIASQPEVGQRPLEETLRNINAVPESVRTAVRNNGGGHHNHSLFWKVMGPAKEDNAPTGRLSELLESSFGSFEKFKDAFNKNAMDQFGSGWSWLVVNSEGNQDKLELMRTANQDSPLMEGKQPVLGLDVWEHAYYLKYQNRRADYVAAWWKVVNWDEVAGQLQF